MCRLTRSLMVALPFLSIVGLGFSQETGVGANDMQVVRDKAMAFLKTRQGKDGSFAPQVAGPGVTALVVAALARNGVSTKEPIQAAALEYLEKQIKKDGGIYSMG